MSMGRGELINWIAFGGGVYLLSDRGMSWQAIAGISLIAFGIGPLKSLIERNLP